MLKHKKTCLRFKHLWNYLSLPLIFCEYYWLDKMCEITDVLLFIILWDKFEWNDDQSQLWRAKPGPVWQSPWWLFAIQNWLYCKTSRLIGNDMLSVWNCLGKLSIIPKLQSSMILCLDRSMIKMWLLSSLYCIRL